jgi:hypothetical protein
MDQTDEFAASLLIARQAASLHVLLIDLKWEWDNLCSHSVDGDT